MLMDPQLTIAGSNQAQGKVSAYFAPVLILFDCMQIETLQSWTLLELSFWIPKILFYRLKFFNKVWPYFMMQNTL